MTNPALRLVGFLAVLFLVIGAAVALDSDDTGGPLGAPGGSRPTVDIGDVRLVAAESCEELAAFFREAATISMVSSAGAMEGGDEMTAVEESAADTSTGSGSPAGSGGDAAASAPSPATTAVADSAQRNAADGEAGGGADDAFSGTNLQERDVDEPDTVKTNGDVAVLATYAGVHVIDVGEDTPELLATVGLEQGSTELLLNGDRVLALTTTWRDQPVASDGGDAAASRMMAPGKEVTILTAIDISDPESPSIVAQVEHEGTYRTARATGTTARIVLVSYPQVAAYDAPTIAATTAEDWTPEGVACDDVVHPTQPQGTSTTTVVTVDMSGDLAALDTDAVVADPGTVYASADRLYIATSQWQAGWQTPNSQPRTELHAFDITDPAATTYAGYGAVDGILLNQISLSEHDGDLRVATTMQPPWDGSGTEQASSSAVVVLGESDGALTEIGRVGDLGVTEVIRSVRFMGDVAYVVTFRQTDPLYVIDLSDPRAPRTAGELKIPGFSSYLHPIDEGRMLGVGQDADEQTGGTLGTQVQTFDVSDMTSPTAIDKVVIEHGSSQVEWDHRAFLWWAARRLAVIPVEVYPPFDDGGVVVDCPPNAICEPTPMPAPDAQRQGFVGAIAFGVDGDGNVREAGRVTHANRTSTGAWHSITRSFVVGDSLYTVSEAGVLQSSLEDFGDQGFAAIPMPQYDDVGVGATSPGSAGVPEPMPVPIEG